MSLYKEEAGGGSVAWGPVVMGELQVWGQEEDCSILGGKM